MVSFQWNANEGGIKALHSGVGGFEGSGGVRATGRVRHQ